MKIWKAIHYAIVLGGLSIVPLAFSLPAWAMSNESVGCRTIEAASMDGWQSGKQHLSVADRAPIVLHHMDMILANAGKQIKPGRNARLAFIWGADWMASYEAEARGAPEAQTVTNLLSAAGCGQSM